MAGLRATKCGWAQGQKILLLSPFVEFEYFVRHSKDQTDIACENFAYTVCFFDLSFDEL